MIPPASREAIWHELECGCYAADLPIWLRLASIARGPILDVGAGTGRVALALAGAGHDVTALDVDGALLQRLRARSLDAGLEIRAEQVDARAFELGARFALCVVPMQTIQLLGGAAGRAAFLRCAGRHLAPGAAVAAAIVDELEGFEVADGDPAPLPDVCERDGVVYSSLPVAVRVLGDRVVLERRREIVTPSGELTVAVDVTVLDRVDVDTLERECRSAGLRPAERIEIPPTDEHAGSTVVVARV